LHIFKGKFDYSNSLTLENKILIVDSIFLSDGILGVTMQPNELEGWHCRKEKRRNGEVVEK
jgi:hypothetical protein